VTHQGVQSCCKVRTRFCQWLTYPTGALAYVILLDQFSRNMFRGTGAAFSSDRAALAAAKVAIDHGWDLRVDAPARQFFYMPLMHSENLCRQSAPRCDPHLWPVSLPQ